MTGKKPTLALAAILIAASTMPAQASNTQTLECIPDTSVPIYHNLFEFDFDAKTVHYYMADDDGVAVKTGIDTSWTAKIKATDQKITWSKHDEGMSMSAVLDRTANTLVSKMHMHMGGDVIEMTEHAKCQAWPPKK